MLVSHDPGEGVAYIYVQDVTTKVARTEQLQSKRCIVHVDYDKSGDVVGIEIVD